MGEASGRHGTIERYWLFGGDARVSRLLSLVLALVVFLLAIPPAPAWAQQTTAAESQSSGDTTTLGATEQVVLVNEENGEEVEALARIDTGAFYTSIGQDLADEIGIDTSTRAPLV
jgi:predicted aspartyl protease